MKRLLVRVVAILMTAALTTFITTNALHVGAGAAVHQGHKYSAGLTNGPALPCGEGRSPIYVVASVTPNDASILTERGIAVSRSVAHYAATRDLQSRITVLLSAHPESGQSVAFSVPRQVVNTATDGPVYPQSSNPSLRSCDIQLSDRPSDAAYVEAAKNALASVGLISAAQATASTDQYLVSDDPLDATQEIVTIYVRGAPVSVGDPTVHAYTIQPYVAFVSDSNHSVTWAGVGPSA